ncbi:MAG: imidazole glycerol phosphate synthase subunit HisH [Candidatus Bathyarchaeota archaeon]
MPKIVIVDLGLGNLRSVENGLEKAGSTAFITGRKEEIREADAIVLPGVGAFEDATRNLKPLSETLLDQVESGKPLLGICLGLQLLFTTSMEGGTYDGLDVLNGKIIRLPESVKIPQIGWNTLKIVKPESPLCSGIPENAFVYFVHSYYAEVENRNDIDTLTEYGIEFPSVVSRKHVFATQFHPEKSGHVGLQMLENFVRYIKA